MATRHGSDTVVGNGLMGDGTTGGNGSRVITGPAAAGDSAADDGTMCDGTTGGRTG